MKSFMYYLIFFIIVPFGSVFAAEAGIIKTISGDVVIQRGDDKITAKKGQGLKSKDILKTKSNSSVGVIFTDGTIFTLGPKSEFQMKNYLFKPDIKAYDFSIFLKKGSAVYNSGKISKLAPQAIKINTPKASVGIRGTKLLITVE